MAIIAEENKVCTEYIKIIINLNEFIIWRDTLNEIVQLAIIIEINFDNRLKSLSWLN